MSENGEIYTAGKNFTLPPAVTAVTNSTSGHDIHLMMVAMVMVVAEVDAVSTGGSVKFLPAV